MDNKAGSEASFIVSQNTYMVDGIQIEAGAELIGFYAGPYVV
ncbi:hypothetical protein [Desulfoscipio gibsoniae]|nr:hypothetical protein [Desulfoscipio gibsoniae]